MIRLARISGEYRTPFSAARFLTYDARESLIFQNCFGVDREFHHIADDDAAFVHGVVPTDAKVLPVDRGCREETRAGLWSLVDSVFPPGCLPLTEVANVEDSRSRDAANR